MPDKLLRIFVGWDGRETVAYHVLAHSIIKRASSPVSVIALARHQLQGLYTRPRGPLEATDFSMSRFIIPALCNYEGYAVFMDCDMLMRADITELWAHIAIQMGEESDNPRVNAFQTKSKAVLCCQHDYVPSETVKFLGQPQTAYPRKNWSSFMIFNNALCKALTPEYVNTATGLDLHRFNWTADDRIGALPLSWNHLVGVYAPSGFEKNIHFTEGGPWFEQYKDVDFAEEWRAERDAMLSTPHVAAVA